MGIYSGYKNIIIMPNMEKKHINSEEVNKQK
jgi:hypothetical protein